MVQIKKMLSSYKTALTPNLEEELDEAQPKYMYDLLGFSIRYTDPWFMTQIVNMKASLLLAHA